MTTDEKKENISFDEFGRIDLRIARVLEAEKIEKTDKLLQLQVEIGGEQRQIIAGIAQNYRPADLIGKRVVVVANLEPATIRGIRSNGMLLAAENETGDLSVITVDRDIETGSAVR
jgi:methionyl-tRNA synthetase